MRHKTQLRLTSLYVMLDMISRGNLADIIPMTRDNPRLAVGYMTDRLFFPHTVEFQCSDTGEFCWLLSLSLSQTLSLRLSLVLI